MEDRLRRIEQLRRTSTETEEDTGAGNRTAKKRTVDERSPQTDSRTSRIRMDEFVVGVKFTEIAKGMRLEVDKLIQTVDSPDLMLEGLKTAVKLGLEAMVGHVEAVMSGVSDMESQDRRQREADAMRVEDRLVKLADKLKEVDNCCDSLVKARVQQRNAESKREMEGKLVTSMSQTKIMDISFGRQMEDKGEIARLAVQIVWEDVRQNETGWYDEIMRRSRVTVLGKGTVRKDSDNGVYYTVPVLVSCKDRNDKWDLEGIVRRAGYFPSFHWPQEILEFVKEARQEVVRLGYSEESHYIRIRPEMYEGKVQLRGDVKPKSGGSFRAKAVWAAPPACKDFWAHVPNLTKPRIIGSLPTSRPTSAAAARLAGPTGQSIENPFQAIVNPTPMD